MDKSEQNFFTAPGTYTDFAEFTREHLYEFELLDRYENQWAIFFTGTYALNPPTPATQLRDFHVLMGKLGELNHSDPDQLHWFARVERSNNWGFHVHGLIGSERVTNGRHKLMTVDQACEFLEREWDHGLRKAVPHDRGEDCVEYVTAIDDSAMIGVTRMSRALEKLLKKAPTSEQRRNEIKEIARYQKEGRDPDMTEWIIKLRRKGTAACFGDEKDRRIAA